MIKIRQMKPAELDRIGEIDRSEEISQGYLCRDGRLYLKDVRFSVPRWVQDGQGEHSVSGIIAVWRPCLEEGGVLFGAFDGDTLAGFAIYRPNISEGRGQLALLHVSKSHRRKGVGAILVARVVELARADDAKELYVSSTFTRGTVDFYQSLGFRPTDSIDRKLFELEPDDIHMTMRF